MGGLQIRQIVIALLILLFILVVLASFPDLIKSLARALPFDIGLVDKDDSVKMEALEIADELSIKLHNDAVRDPIIDYPCFASVGRIDLPTGYSLRFFNEGSSLVMELRDNYDDKLESYKERDTKIMGCSGYNCFSGIQNYNSPWSLNLVFTDPPVIRLLSENKDILVVDEWNDDKRFSKDYVFYFYYNNSNSNRYLTLVSESYSARLISNDARICGETNYITVDYGRSQTLLDVMQYAKTNRIEGKLCLCGDECDDYAEWVVEYSEEYNVDDPFLVLAIMMQESECEANVVSAFDAVGLMQVKSEDLTEEELKDPETNIKEGINILHNKYSEYANGVLESDSYKTNSNFESLVDDCVTSYPKYGTYVSWSAALRGYNGWGCTIGADPDFVEEVVRRYQELKNV